MGQKQIVCCVQREDSFSKDIPDAPEDVEGLRREMDIMSVRAEAMCREVARLHRENEQLMVTCTQLDEENQNLREDMEEQGIDLLEQHYRQLEAHRVLLAVSGQSTDRSERSVPTPVRQWSFSREDVRSWSICTEDLEHALEAAAAKNFDYLETLPEGCVPNDAADLAAGLPRHHSLITPKSHAVKTPPSVSDNGTPPSGPFTPPIDDCNDAAGARWQWADNHSCPELAEARERLKKNFTLLGQAQRNSKFDALDAKLSADLEVEESASHPAIGYRCSKNCVPSLVTPGLKNPQSFLIASPRLEDLFKSDHQEGGFDMVITSDTDIDSAKSTAASSERT